MSIDRRTSLSRAACRVAVAASALLAACASNQEAATLRNKPPAPLVVVVEAAAPTGNGGGGLQFAADGAAMAQLLSTELRALDAASRVVLAGQPGADQADIRIRLAPRGAVGFAHAGTANFFGAGALWLTTWIGGLLVEDSAYDVRMDAECRYAVVDAEDQFTFTRTVNGGTVDLAFFDRNDLFSMPGLQSLLLPPFWTTDQADKTSAALTRSSMRLAAQQIATELKNDFESSAETNYRCAVRFESPRNGAVVAGATMPLSLLVVSKSEDAVSKVTASVDGGAPIELKLAEVDGDTVRATGVLAGLRQDRDNLVRITVTAGKLHTRTLRLAAAR